MTEFAPSVAKRRPDPRAPARPISNRFALFCLVLAAFCWGGGNVANKTLLEHIGPLTAISLRCLLAFAVLSPVLIRRRQQPQPAGWWASGLLVGALFALAMVLAQVAYLWTSVTHVSFLVNTCAALTPVVAWLVLGHRFGPGIVVAAILSVAGAWAMSGMTRLTDLNPGDLASIGSALAFALWSVALGQHAQRFGAPVSCAVLQFLVTALLAGPAALWIEAPRLDAVVQAWPELALLGLMSTAAATVLTAFAQRHVPASSAALILSTESAFGAAGAFVILGERLDLMGAVGAVLILVSAMLAARATPPATKDL